MTVHRILLLGQDETEYGSHRLVEGSSGALAASLSVGSDPNSPSLRAKGDPSQPNEDALLALDDGRHVLLAVADAHHGAEASHRLIELLDRAVPSPAVTRQQLSSTIELLVDPESDPEGSSECAFLVAAYDRESREGFGQSWGDASFVVVRPGLLPEVSNTHDSHWVTAARPVELAPWRSKPFRFTAEPGDLLVAFTDGIDGCHYDHRENSVGMSHLEALFAEQGPAPASFAKSLTEMALAGVDGHPGGQDNIALVVVGA